MFGPAGLHFEPFAVVLFVNLIERGKTVPARQIWGVQPVNDLPSYLDLESSDHETSDSEYVPSMQDSGSVALEAHTLSPNTRKWFLDKGPATNELGIGLGDSLEIDDMLPAARFAAGMWNSPNLDLPPVIWTGGPEGLIEA